MVVLDFSGKNGKRGKDGNNAIKQGAAGDDAQQPGDGFDASNAYLTLSRSDQSENTLVLEGTVNGGNFKKFYQLTNELEFAFILRGGEGGKGGRGGNGASGKMGKIGLNGQNGGDGGNGGNGGSGTHGGNGGKGGQLEITVKKEEMDLLQLVKSIDIHGGDGGFAGSHGHGGRGGMGGTGGYKYNFSKQRNEQGKNGKSGKDGKTPSSQLRQGKSGRDGAFKFIIQGTQGTLEYEDKYFLRVAEFSYQVGEDNEYVQPGDKGVISSVKITNTGKMPSPAYTEFTLVAVEESGLIVGTQEFSIKNSIKPNTGTTFDTDIQFEVKEPPYNYPNISLKLSVKILMKSVKKAILTKEVNAEFLYKQMMIKASIEESKANNNEQDFEFNDIQHNLQGFNQSEVVKSDEDFSIKEVMQKKKIYHQLSKSYSQKDFYHNYMYFLLTSDADILFIVNNKTNKGDIDKMLALCKYAEFIPNFYDLSVMKKLMILDSQFGAEKQTICQMFRDKTIVIFDNPFVIEKKQVRALDFIFKKEFLKAINHYNIKFVICSNEAKLEHLTGNFYEYAKDTLIEEFDKLQKQDETKKVGKFWAFEKRKNINKAEDLWEFANNKYPDNIHIVMEYSYLPTKFNLMRSVKKMSQNLVILNQTNIGEDIFPFACGIFTTIDLQRRTFLLLEKKQKDTPESERQLLGALGESVLYTVAKEIRFGSKSNLANFEFIQFKTFINTLRIITTENPDWSTQGIEGFLIGIKTFGEKQMRFKDKIFFLSKHSKIQKKLRKCTALIDEILENDSILHQKEKLKEFHEGLKDHYHTNKKALPKIPKYFYLTTKILQNKLFLNVDHDTKIIKDWKAYNEKQRHQEEKCQQLRNKFK